MITSTHSISSWLLLAIEHPFGALITSFAFFAAKMCIVLAYILAFWPMLYLPVAFTNSGLMVFFTALIATIQDVGPFYYCDFPSFIIADGARNWFFFRFLKIVLLFLTNICVPLVSS